MEKRTAQESIEHNTREGKGIEMVSCDKIVSSFFLYIFQTLAKAVYGDDQIDKIGKSIERLTDELIHIRVLAELSINTTLGIKPLPYHMSVEYIIQNGNNWGKNYRTDYR